MGVHGVVWLIVLSAATGQVAITEVLNNPDGADKGREWVELLNFGPDPVDVSGWTLGDEGSDVFVFEDAALPPGGYLVVVSGGSGGVDAATAKAIFEAEWLGGVSVPVVIGMAGTALANGSDELLLCDTHGRVVWSLAWSDDETPPFATFLTETSDFSVSVYGSAASPGVVRHGDDNGTAGFPGYEQNDGAPDPFARLSDVSQLAELFGEDFLNVELASVGSPLAGGYEVIPAGDLDHDGAVGVLDLLVLIIAWGPCPVGGPCPADLDGDGLVGITDLLALLEAWG